MREEAKEVLTGLKNHPNTMLRPVKEWERDSKEVEGGICMRGSDGKLCLSEKEKAKVWKDYMERIVKEENDWDRNVEGDAVEDTVVCVRREEVIQALIEMKIRKAPGLTDVSLELIAASGGVRIQVMAKIYQSCRWIWNAS